MDLSPHEPYSIRWPLLGADQAEVTKESFMAGKGGVGSGGWKGVGEQRWWPLQNKLCNQGGRMKKERQEGAKGKRNAKPNPKGNPKQCVLDKASSWPVLNPQVIVKCSLSCYACTINPPSNASVPD